MPCEDPKLGWWSNERNCYVQLVTPPPAPEDPLWRGQKFGAIYWCNLPLNLENSRYKFWAGDQPAGPKAPPDPAALARKLKAQLQFRAFKPTMSVPETPQAAAIIGVPVWIWNPNPTPETWGPQTVTATEQNISVTLTATTNHITYHMGNNQDTICYQPGAPYPYNDTTALQNIKPSPNCGYTYTKTGSYTITATSYWDVTWTSNTGAKGTLDNDPINTTIRTLDVAEIQVVRQ